MHGALIQRSCLSNKSFSVGVNWTVVKALGLNGARHFTATCPKGVLALGVNGTVVKALGLNGARHFTVTCPMRVLALGVNGTVVKALGLNSARHFTATLSVGCVNGQGVRITWCLQFFCFCFFVGFF